MPVMTKKKKKIPVKWHVLNKIVNMWNNNVHSSLVTATSLYSVLDHKHVL